MAIIYYVNEREKFLDDAARFNVQHYFERSPEFLTGGYGVDPATAALDMQRTAEAFGKNSKKRLYHFVIAFPAGKVLPLENLKQAMDGISYQIGQLYQVFYSIHTDKAHLHVHLMMNAVSYVNGKKFRGDRSSLHEIEKIIRHGLYQIGEMTAYLVYDQVPREYMDFAD